MKKISVLFLFSLIFIFASCGQKNSYRAETAPSERVVTTNGMMKKSSVMKLSDSMEYDAAYEEQSGSEAESVSERKIIQTGNIHIQVPDFDEVTDLLENLVKNYKGYVVSSYSYTSEISMTIRVPCDAFDAVMTEIGNFGKVTYSNRSAQDVTESYYDLESRINTKKILKEKLEGYLKQSASLKDLLEVERQLNDVVSELESMEGRMRRLSNQIEYSTVNICLKLPQGYDDAGFVWPDMKEKLSSVGINIVYFFSGFLGFIIYIAAYGIPVIALLAVLYWLLFGRIGLLIRLFKVLSKKK